MMMFWNYRNVFLQDVNLLGPERKAAQVLYPGGHRLHSVLETHRQDWLWKGGYSIIPDELYNNFVPCNKMVYADLGLK